MIELSLKFIFFKVELISLFKLLAIKIAPSSNILFPDKLIEISDLLYLKHSPRIKHPSSPIKFFDKFNFLSVQVAFFKLFVIFSNPNLLILLFDKFKISVGKYNIVEILQKIIDTFCK